MVWYGIDELPGYEVGVRGGGEAVCLQVMSLKSIDG